MTTVYLAGSYSGTEVYALRNAGEEIPVNVLVAFPYYKKYQASMQDVKVGKLALDSGAFSAFNSGVEIDLGEYIELAKELKADDTFALDVIGDHKAGIKNTEEMWRRGVDAIPVYHPGEPWSVLDWCCDNADKIAVGSGSNLRSDGTTWRGSSGWYIDQVFSRAWPKKIHGLAITRISITEKLPFHSCDSTSWYVAPHAWGLWHQGRNALQGKLTARLSSYGCKDTTSQVHYFQERERYLKHIWKRELKQLEGLPRVRTKSNAALPS